MKTPVEMVSGAFAGFCSSVINNPIDVVKTKMQGKDAASDGERHTHEDERGLPE